MSSPERRAAIVAAASRLFAERGFRGTTTRELASAVGVTEPVLYEHFRSKRDLYRAIIETKSREGMERVAAEIEPLMRRNDDRGVFSRLAKLIMDRYAREPAFFRLLLFLALEGDELAGLFYRRQILEAHRLVAGYIRRRMGEGDFRRMDPAVAVRAFLAMPVHHSMVRLLFDDQFVKASRKRTIEGMVDVFLQGVRR